ncbi:FimV/HubP family polar landmark protein [Vibrio rhodolitus]|uniref:FimV/HubP family polar landmark protein n=1 Tax=Vibrio rhodolitus TaxID=2231649 RepID=UPI000E0BE49C|nr:FimV/HubP family polar landmark protein [Vibrio rhodolitus]
MDGDSEVESALAALRGEELVDEQLREDELQPQATENEPSMLAGESELESDIDDQQLATELDQMMAEDLAQAEASEQPTLDSDDDFVLQDPLAFDELEPFAESDSVELQPESIEPQAEPATEQEERTELPGSEQPDPQETEAELEQNNAFEFDDLDLPEYGEEQALADFAAGEPDSDVLDTEELVTDETVTDELAATPELDTLPQPEPVEPQAEPATEQEDSADLSGTEQPELQDVEAELEQSNAFEFDDLDLPEYGEEQALADFAAGEPDSDALDTEELVTDETVTDELAAAAELDTLPQSEPVEPQAETATEQEQRAELPVTEQPELQEAELEQSSGFEFDDLDLPEYGEEQALADFAAGEPDSDVLDTDDLVTDEKATDELAAAPELDTLPQSEPVEPQVETATEQEQRAELPVTEQPELPEAELEQSSGFEFDDLDLPEYGEEQALADFAAGEPDSDALDSEELVTDEIVTDELAAAPELDTLSQEQPEPVEPQAETALEQEDLVESLDTEPQELQEVEAELEQSSGFEFDDLDLPEYGEEQALADFAAGDPDALQANEASTLVEQDEAEPSEVVQQEELSPELDTLSQVEPESVEPQTEPVAEQNEFSESSEFDEVELTASEPAPEDLISESLPEPEELAPFNDEVLDRTLDESDVLAGLFGGEALNDIDTDVEPENAPLQQTAATQQYDEQTLNELLDEANQDYAPISKPLDREVSDSAGMDLEAMLEMGGEDWNGFSLSPEQQASISDDIPEDEMQIWAGDQQPAQANIHDEDWESQDDLADFNPREHQYRTIDELMAEVEQQEAGFDPDAEELKLDVGLADFPDVIGEMSDIDVDSNSEAAGKLDLAKIYIEMNDSTGAVRLLEEAIVDGSDDIRREAKRLIDSINSRA